MKMQKLTPELILKAYSRGLFPMADNAEADEVYWYDPEMRGQLPIRALHIPRRLRKTARKMPYQVTFNAAFSDVVQGCSDIYVNREETWINAPIREAFESLHWAGYAHSVEAWKDGELVGGLYGLAIGGAFFGESMFSLSDNASKIALIHLCAHLDHQGFTLLDTQFVNEHLKQFGVYEVPRDEYLLKLGKAVQQDVQFVPDESASGDESRTSSVFGRAVSFKSDSDVFSTFLQSMIQIS